MASTHTTTRRRGQSKGRKVVSDKVDDMSERIKELTSAVLSLTTIDKKESQTPEKKTGMTTEDIFNAFNQPPRSSLSVLPTDDSTEDRLKYIESMIKFLQNKIESNEKYSKSQGSVVLNNGFKLNKVIDDLNEEKAKNIALEQEVQELIKSNTKMENDIKTINGILVDLINKMPNNV